MLPSKDCSDGNVAAALLSRGEMLPLAVCVVALDDDVGIVDVESFVEGAILNYRRARILIPATFNLIIALLAPLLVKTWSLYCSSR